LPPTSVLIRIHAISLNFRDPNMLHGNNPWPILPTGIPCSDAAGSIIALGSSTTRGFKVEDRVSPIVDQASITGTEQTRTWLSADVDGVLASHLVIDESLVVKVPEHLTWAESACLPCAGVTAWSSIVSAEARKLNAGQTILVQGTGGVSIMAMKLGLAAGCKVFVTSSSDSKLERIREMAKRGGREEQVGTINYKTTPAWEEEVRRLNNGIGVDIVLENGGTSSTLQSLRATKKGGIISQVGYLGKQDPMQLDGLIPMLIDKAVNFRGINVGSRLDFEEMNNVIASTGMRFEDVIDRTFGFEQEAVEAAFDYLWQGKHVGKVVIEVP
jgi:NADPH:quinone reductase-like Zn-dependent oxidoreductase